MKFGLIGVGKWGMTLAGKLIGLGHTVVCHSRLHLDKLPVVGVGDLVPWIDIPQLADAVVIATPPSATTKIAAHMVDAGVPVLATKPVFGASEILRSPVTAPVYVDFVHLHSPGWWAVCDEVDECKKKGITVSKVEAFFYGDGPVRDYEGFFDYSPHAIAAVFDLLEIEGFDIKKCSRTSSAPGRELYCIEGRREETEIWTITGNDATEKSKRARVLVTFSDGKTSSYEEDFPAVRYIGRDGEIVSQRHDPLATIIRELVEDIETGAAFPEDLILSMNVEAILRTAQQSVAPSP